MAEYIRIDRGVKRGKRSPTVRTRNDLGQYCPILPKDPEIIRGALTDYAGGATLQQLGDRYGVDRAAIYAWTLGNLAPPEHEELVRRALTARIARSDHMLETAPEPVNVTRGREMARFARMDYERLRPAIYGQSQVAVQVNANGPIQVNVVSFAAIAQTPVIEGTCVEQDVMSKACTPSILPPSDPE